MGEGNAFNKGHMLYAHRELAMQQTLLERARGRIQRGLGSAGLVVRRHGFGQLDTQWMVSDDGDTGTVRVHTTSGDWPAYYDGANTTHPRLLDHVTRGAIFYDGEGVPCEFDADMDDATLALTDDDTWYTLVVVAEETEYGPGTIYISPSDVNFLGTGTQFTDLLVSAAGVWPSRLLVDPADTVSGHDGTYVVDTISDDGDLDVVTASSGTPSESVRYKPSAQFTVAPSDRGFLARRRGKLKLVARTRTPNNNEYVLADVKRNDAGSPKVQIIDRRHQNLQRQVPGGGSEGLVAVPKALVTESAGTLERLERSVVSGASPYTVKGVAPRGDGTVLVLVVFSASTAVFRYDGSWTSAGVGAGAANVGGLVALPPIRHAGTWNTHLVAKGDGAGDVDIFASANRGTSFSSFATGVWGPAGADTVTPEDMYMTKYGRLILVGEYTATAQVSVRYIYSDDLGATWSTNSGAGWEIAADTLTFSYHHGLATVGPDGQIWTTLANSVPDSWVYVRGTTLHNPAPNAPASANEQIDGTSDVPSIVMLPNGELLEFRWATGTITVETLTQRIVSATHWSSSGARDIMERSATTITQLTAHLNRRTGLVHLFFAEGNNLHEMFVDPSYSIAPGARLL